MIVCGYQGIGKSTLAKNNPRVIDLESGNFYVDGIRNDDWYKMYVNIAIHLHQQGKIVFMSSHKIVRDELRSRGADFTFLIPDKDLYSDWCKKLADRYEESGLDKDYRAWQNCLKCFKNQWESEFVAPEEIDYIKTIKSIDYVLADLVK